MENYIEQQRVETVDNGKEQIVDNIWRPAIFDDFEDIVEYGGSTLPFKEETGGDNERVELKVFSNLERLQLPLRDKLLATRFLIELQRKIASTADSHNIIKTKLVHGQEVLKIDREFLDLARDEQVKHSIGYDGMITNISNVPLFVPAADCAPVAILDPQHKAIGIFHAGWRGILSGIVTKGIDQLTQNFESLPQDLRVSIGPSLNKENFEIDFEMYDQFCKIFSQEEMEILTTAVSSKLPGQHYLFDAKNAIRMQLEKIGVPKEQIEISSIDTMDSEGFFPSARKAGGVQNVDSSVFIMNIKK